LKEKEGGSIKHTSTLLLVLPLPLKLDLVFLKYIFPAKNILILKILLFSLLFLLYVYNFFVGDVKRNR